ncbi:hypothetical protein [Acinetobacter sp. YH01008]|uniref:hypothetical protein n=1 Tax=Acinetobacter sp. YH01008 TaxID=2601024 RepID=UPI0015D1C0BE|nr:hypothetical protein [Acinetobacter sp. YH01008]MBU3847259.1 hypothetical protein [Candidatus Acinetobacter avistercoris]
MEYFERDRQLAEVAESLEEKRKNLLNISQKELNRELQLWRVNEKQMKARDQKTDEEQIIDLFFK